MSIRYNLDDFLTFSFQRGYFLGSFKDVAIFLPGKMKLGTGCLL